MSFSVAPRSQRYEVDFASAGNDLQLRSLINTVGGMYTASSQDGMWLSQGAPRVLAISQDANTVVVDLEHTVQQARVSTDAAGNVRVEEILSPTPGKVVVRIYLRRQKTLPRLSPDLRSVSQARSQRIGYFGADFVGDNANAPIQRFNLGDAQDRATRITYYLKDVPAAFQGVAKQAVLSWNQAFGSEVFSVEIAPPGVDAGDPRYHVIKWFDGTDNSLGWAGVAKMIVDPDSGLVMSGTLYIQGNTLIKLYGDIVSYSESVGRQPLRRLVGRIGNIDFSHDDGEKPVIPFLTDLSKNFDDYMQGYYLETIAHEVGHTLGLRHNFRGSTQLIANETASVMDYAPRAERDHYKGPGFYDKAAIRFGYFGERPVASLPFCTDEDLWNLYDCSQGDWGDPVKNAVRGLIDGTMLLAQRPVGITRDEQVSSITGSLENALKIRKLSAQLPASQRAEALTNIDAARAYLFNAAVDSSLSAADQAKAAANLTKMRDAARKKEQELQQAGRL